MVYPPFSDNTTSIAYKLSGDHPHKHLIEKSCETREKSNEDNKKLYASLVDRFSVSNELSLSKQVTVDLNLRNFLTCSI